jgi:hypothetical protein
MSYEEEDTCMSYEEEYTHVSSSSYDEALTAVGATVYRS